MIEQLRAMIKLASSFCEQRFKHVGIVYPGMLGWPADGSEMVILMPERFGSVQDKNFFMLSATRVFKERNVDRYVFFSESWLAEKPAQLGIPPSEDPNRIEVVHYAAETRTQQCMGIQRIVRPKRGKAKLAPLEFEYGMIGGRFAHLLETTH
jgi:hypothetical protein